MKRQSKLAWLSVVVAFGCSFLINWEGTNGDYVKSVVLFLGGFVCAALVLKYQ